MVLAHFLSKPSFGLSGSLLGGLGSLGAFWMLPACLLGASWVAHGCLADASWLLPEHFMGGFWRILLKITLQLAPGLLIHPLFGVSRWSHFCFLFTTRVHKNDEEVLGPVICMSSRRGPLFV